MEPLRWVLLLIGLALLGMIFAYGRGVRGPTLRADWLKRFLSRGRKPADQSNDESAEIRSAPPAPKPATPTIGQDSRVVTVRVMPRPGAHFPAEELIIALRKAGLRHGRFGIFHRLDEADGERIRYSVASLVEPGSFDLSNLKEAEYRGISIFMVLPAAEDGVILFDEMVETARRVARDIDGRLVDEQGGAMSVQRERYMREEVIEYLRLHRRTASVRAQ